MVSFKNTLVLLTSNIGSRVIAASSGGGLAAFGSRRSLMGGGEEGEETLSRAEQVRLSVLFSRISSGSLSKRQRIKQACHQKAAC